MRIVTTFVIALVVLAMVFCSVDAQDTARRAGGKGGGGGGGGQKGGNGGNNGGNAGQNNGGNGQNQAGDSKFLDRASFVPARLNVKQLDKFFTRKSEFCNVMGSRGFAQADGTQIRTGVCVSTAMGALPKFELMSSQIVVEPANGATLQAGNNNTVRVRVRNLKTGFFDNPNAGYYICPQTLDDNGIIEGHTHISCQSIDPNTAPDATQFVFFKGLNDAANNGELSTTIPAGSFKSAGLHRCCTISGTFSHQPVIMPVAQRGAQDDCVRFNVVLGGGNSNGGGGGNGFVKKSTTAGGAKTATTTTSKKSTKIKKTRTTKGASVTTTVTTTTSVHGGATSSSKTTTTKTSSVAGGGESSSKAATASAKPTTTTTKTHRSGGHHHYKHSTVNA
ncbi:hypothetical protein BJ742DRAFT_840444 [Cladochytrium replicatum]|nr:hypothetical protein BJ742DRAFT_840444 [Cladochytrium replicatum]